MRGLTSLTAALLIAAALPAFADPSAPATPAPPPQPQVIHYINPDDMAALMRELGYRAEIRNLSSDKSKMIATGMDGWNVAVYLFNCTNGAQCASLEFETTFDKDPTYTLTLANNWNSQRRYTKAYIDPQTGALTFDFDFFVDGTTIGAVKSSVTFYEGELDRFAKFFRK